MRKKYTWPDNRSGKYSVSAQVVGERISQIEEKYGRAEAPVVLNDARPLRSPLHKCFTWDDGEAAEQYRLCEARQLIRSVRVVVKKGPEEKVHRAFVNVVFSKDEESESERGYVSLDRAAADENMRNIILDQAIRDLQAWTRRYEEIREVSSMAPIFKVVDKVVSQSIKKRLEKEEE